MAWTAFLHHWKENRHLPTCNREKRYRDHLRGNTSPLRMQLLKSLWRIHPTTEQKNIHHLLIPEKCKKKILRCYKNTSKTYYLNINSYFLINSSFKDQSRSIYDRKSLLILILMFWYNYCQYTKVLKKF